jgi:hypothetical protein
VDNLTGDPNGSASGQLADGVELDVAGALLDDDELEEEPDEEPDEEDEPDDEDEESEGFDSLLADEPSAAPFDDEEAGLDEVDVDRLSLR